MNTGEVFVTTPLPGLNLALAWLWILLGFGSGLILGLGFQREDWLGGYNSLKRRLYRLGHISFFGLGAVNLMFHLTAQTLPGNATFLSLSSWLFVVGAVAMPVSCLIMAHQPKARMLFAVPVLSLLVAGTLTLWMVIENFRR